MWCCCRFVLPMFDLTLLVGVKEGLWIAISDQFTVKLGYYVHGLVRTLGYNVLSVNHGHRQSENMYIFFG